ncbi:hypothetical protein BC832DRAFT_558799 [Gaertneriomyces semiglobifer]|nr:hypothetical protein BC832DRAFT_558799 [Gaertneriomyces semiglobifer]
MAAVAGRQLFVGNLPYVVGWQDLKDLFRQAGTVVRADVVASPAGRSRGFGTVLFQTAEEAQAAISMFNDYEWNGRKIEVREDRGPSAAVAQPPIAIGNAPVLNGNTNANPTVNVRALYVGNIPYSAGWQDLKDLFRQAGNVVRADVPSDFQGRSKGFGTIVMGTVDEARKAMTVLNNYEWSGRRIEVREDRTFVEGGAPARPFNNNGGPAPVVNNVNVSAPLPPANGSTAGRQLFVGNLPFMVQWQELKDLFREAGNVQRADVAMDNQGRSRGYGQVVMGTVEEAEAAIKLLNGKDVQGRVIEVREDKFAAEGGPAAGGTQVFVGNLPYSVRWQDLKDLFRPHGLNPIHADVMAEPGTGRSKGCGIVRFSTPEEAERAVQEANGSNVNGRNVVVRLDKFAA